MVIDRRYLIEEAIADVKGEMLDMLDDLGARRPGFDYASATCHGGDAD
jgi:succinyl-diaminopimelate desuccinylase